MLERVNHISSDPLSAVHEEEERMLMEELTKRDSKSDVKEAEEETEIV